MGIAGMLAGPAAAEPTIQLGDVPSLVAGHRMVGEAAGDRLGVRGEPVGDVNGDGLGDFAVSAHLNDTLGTGRGRCYVVFGRTTGASNISPTSIAAGTGGFVINGDNNSDYAGFVAGVGDVNDDGLADLLVSAANATAPAGATAGRCYVVFGKSSGSAVDLGSVASGIGGFVINGEAAGDQVGSPGGGGDINGDGMADLIVGANLKDAPAVDAGRTYVVFGKATTSAVNLTDVVGGVGGFAINGEAANDQIDRGDCAGDVNGDGLADVMISSLFALSGAGRAYIVFGKASGAAVNLAALGTGGFKIDGEEPNDAAGLGIAALGDVNSDGLADIGLCSQIQDQGGPSALGRGYVVFGKTSSATVALTAVAAGNGGYAINGNGLGFGAHVGAAGDANGDGRGDLLISRPFTPTDQGTIFLLYGKSTGSVINTNAIPPSSLGYMLEGVVDEGETLGSALLGGEDFNGDGRPDLMMASFRATQSLNEQGRAYLVYNTGSVSTSGTYTSWFDNIDPDRQGVGGTALGDDATSLPGSRLWVDYNSGFGTGVGQSSSATVVLTRNKVGVVGFNPAFLANVRWQLTSNRTAPGTHRVTVRYTDAEIAGLTEGALSLYSAPSVAGPWTATSNQVLNLVRNEASGDVSALTNFLVLSTAAPDATPPTVMIDLIGGSPTTNQIARWNIEFSEPVNPSFDTADISLTGTLAASSDIISLTNVDPLYGLILYPVNHPVDGTLGFQIPAGSVTDIAGNPLAVTAVSPLVHIDDPAGPAPDFDINQDGFVNVADVTALANFVVNGILP